MKTILLDLARAFVAHRNDDFLWGRVCALLEGIIATEAVMDKETLRVILELAKNKNKEVTILVLSMYSEYV